MEARRLERQRRASAKCSAAPTLPSSQDQEFQLRMIDLYGQHECLWNTTLCEYHDAEMKREAWEDIARKLGAHLKAAFVRNCIQSMRYRLNLYKLQQLEYKMSPAHAKQPEKLFFMDKFGFLDTILNSDDEAQEEQSELEQSDLDSSLSIANICEQRVQQQQMQLPLLVQRLRNSHRGKQSTILDASLPSVIKKRLLPTNSEALAISVVSEKPQFDSSLRSRVQQLSLMEQGKELPSDSSDARASLLTIPSVVRKRLQQQEREQLIHEAPLELTAEKSSDKITEGQSQLSIPQHSAGNSMRAQPGDSISKTHVGQLNKSSRNIEALESLQQSEDEDLFRLHWSVRQEQSSRRAIALPPKHELHPSQAMPRLLFETSLPSSSLKPKTYTN